MFSFLGGGGGGSAAAGAGAASGAKPDVLKDQVRAWTSDIKKEMREVDRQIRSA